MNRENSVFKTDDGSCINLLKWLPDNLNDLKGIVQIVHGMVEHAGRYEYFANQLANQGYVVYANDHRGHGKTAVSKDDLGHLDENGWDNVVKDVYMLSLLIKKDYPEEPLFLFGHSMGSFIARDYISKYANLIKGVIICGTGYTSVFMINFGIAVSKMEMKKYGQKHRSEFINKLAFSSNNRKFEPGKTEFDWLTRDEEEVNKYIKDDLCGGICTAGFFNNLFKGLKKIQSMYTITEIPKQLPIFLISGDSDPVGNYGKAVEKLYKLYKKTGFKNVKMKLYKDCRHELLNEINRDEIIADIIQWINKQM